VSNDDSMSVIYIVGALILAISALSAKRMTFGAVLRSLLGWAVVIGIVWTVVVHRDQVETVAVALAERLGLGDQKVVGDTVRITMSADGHFWARATLNGVPKRLLIDSGATITALSADTARLAGVEVGSGFPVAITTANGTIPAQRGSIATVKVGDLETRSLGVVVSAAFGDVDVLGMNFLSRLGSWRVEGRTLILEPKRPAA
jgi:aspartyl protease family protein